MGICLYLGRCPKPRQKTFGKRYNKAQLVSRFFFEKRGPKKKLWKKKCQVRSRRAAPLRVERPLLKKRGKTIAWFEWSRHKFSIKHECFIGLTNKIPLREQALDGDFVVQTTKNQIGDLIFLKFTCYYCRRKESANIPSIEIVANYRFLKRL